MILAIILITIGIFIVSIGFAVAVGDDIKAAIKFSMILTLTFVAGGILIVSGLGLL